MDNKNYPQVRDSGLVVQEMPDEVLIYDLNTNKAHCLNDSAAKIWRACDGTRSIADIVKQFERHGDGTVTEDFVWLAIDQLNDNGLLQTGTPARFTGQSRRVVLKKIGLATMVGLPIIASLAAPQNTLASSSCSCSIGSSGDTYCQTTAPANCPHGSCGGGGVCIGAGPASRSYTKS